MYGDLLLWEHAQSSIFYCPDPLESVTCSLNLPRARAGVSPGKGGEGRFRKRTHLGGCYPRGIHRGSFPPTRAARVRNVSKGMFFAEGSCLEVPFSWREPLFCIRSLGCERTATGLFLVCLSGPDFL
ncbi:hypothetical protein AVEN_99578-1 [Araneus ventricosus]|uniref:Uncharacterized protein n=1 Tax=Araneus ventricosus TaxID=182803 RepID=A0A4Y2RVH3_ARAVE|nr:hypothetical protein AVEN_99578-1 [Araneus ventricosus]